MSDDNGTFSRQRLQGRVRNKAQQAVAPLMEEGEEIIAMVPGRSAGPERKRRGLLGSTQHKLAVVTARNVYVFTYRFGRIKEVALKQELGSLPVTVHDETGGGGYMTIGDLSLRVGASVWRDWREEARRIVELNYGST